jgi:hypothetical protein
MNEFIGFKPRYLVGRLSLDKENNKWYLNTRTPMYTLGSETILLDNSPIPVHMNYKYPFGISKYDINIIQDMSAIVECSKFNEEYYLVRLEIDY